MAMDLRTKEQNVKSMADKVVRVAIQDSNTSRNHQEMNATRTNAFVPMDLRTQEPHVKSMADKVVGVAIQVSRTSRNHQAMNATPLQSTDASVPTDLHSQEPNAKLTDKVVKVVIKDSSM